MISKSYYNSDAKHFILMFRTGTINLFFSQTNSSNNKSFVQILSSTYVYSLKCVCNRVTLINQLRVCENVMCLWQSECESSEIKKNLIIIIMQLH